MTYRLHKLQFLNLFITYIILTSLSATIDKIHHKLLMLKLSGWRIPQNAETRFLFHYLFLQMRMQFLGFPLRIVQKVLLVMFGSKKFYVYHSFQPMRSWANNYAQDCSAGIYKWQLSIGTRNGIVSNFLWILAKFLPNCATNFSNEMRGKTLPDRKYVFQNPD